MIVQQPNYEAERQALRKLAARVCLIHAEEGKSLCPRDAARLARVLFQTHDELREVRAELEETLEDLQVSDMVRQSVAERAWNCEQLALDLRHSLELARPYVARVAAPFLVHPPEVEDEARLHLAEIDHSLQRREP